MTTPHSDDIYFKWMNSFREINNPTKFLTPAQVAVLFSLATRADGGTGERMFRSRVNLARDVGCDVKTVDSALRRAVQLNLFEKVRSGNSHGTANEYRLVHPSNWRVMASQEPDGSYKPWC